MNIKELSNKDKREVVKKLFNTYIKLKAKKMTIKKINELKNSKNQIDISQLSIFESILSVMNRDELLVLEKEYIDTENKLWWHDYFSKSTFYKIKNRAITNLLYLVYE